MAEVDVSFHPAARQEYLDALRSYMLISERVARRFQENLVRSVDLIAEGPERWPLFDDPIRFVRLRRFPYVLYYESTSETTVQILAVAHSRRRPGYWADRRDH
ncbi:MAG: type II toxin-antitoxin system RelE/ParE family toxin [Planctomycetota bacterium]